MFTFPIHTCDKNKSLERGLAHISMAGPIQERLRDPTALGLGCQELCEVMYFSL